MQTLTLLFTDIHSIPHCECFRTISKSNLRRRCSHLVPVHWALGTSTKRVLGSDTGHCKDPSTIQCPVETTYPSMTTAPEFWCKYLEKRSVHISVHRESSSGTCRAQAPSVNIAAQPDTVVFCTFLFPVSYQTRQFLPTRKILAVERVDESAFQKPNVFQVVSKDYDDALQILYLAAQVSLTIWTPPKETIHELSLNSLQIQNKSKEYSKRLSQVQLFDHVNRVQKKCGAKIIPFQKFPSARILIPSV